MLRIGLTGGIASGKSHVLRGLGRAGYATVDLDAVAHEVLRPGGAAFAAVVAAFGAGILDASGAIDRRALGEHVFRERPARARLNGIVHPHIREQEERLARAAAVENRLMVTDGALLVETGAHLRFDRLIVAHCSQAQQIERLERRDGMSAEEALRRIEAQMPSEEKRRFASFEVDTSGGADATDAQVAQLTVRLEALAQSKPGRAGVSLQQAVGCVVQAARQGGRGLAPSRVLVAVADAGTIDLSQLARLVDAEAGAPWYELAQRCGAESQVEAGQLSAVAVLWVLGRRGLDREGAVAAAASLARLTDRGAEAIAGACLAADALWEVARKGRLSAAFSSESRCWEAEALKWGDASPSRRVTAALEAATAYPRDVDAAQGRCRTLGGSAELCGALVGLATGAGASDASAELIAACRKLGYSE